MKGIFIPRIFRSHMSAYLMLCKVLASFEKIDMDCVQGHEDFPNYSKTLSQTGY